ncbi:MAG TPA: M23 family metallopeptidase [Bacteroidota bacterium]|nr:M23 family metallopeptidase [Bacteroidota bacterium]
MAKKGKKRIYFYYDDQLQVREVKWYRLRMTGKIGLSVVVILALLLVVNHLVNDVLGIEHDRLTSLMKENQVLQQQMALLTSQISQLQTNVDSIDRQGNVLRLMVDLPTIDQETRKAGTGGAVMQPVLPPVSDQTAQVLQTVSSSLSRLKSEMSVQEQSYRQIVRKAEYNKGYFAALPALKPMDGYYSKTGYGLRMHPVLGIFRTHNGLDIINDVGTPVYASGDGVVDVAGMNGGGYGNMIVLNHGYGYQSLYAHLSKILVREGQHVKRGDLIAKSGKTGLVSGPHLHYEIRHDGVSVNPVNFFFDDITARQYREQIASQ